MNEHAGPACALSVLIVGIFAVILHEGEHPPSPSNLSARDLRAPQPTPPGRIVVGDNSRPIRETALVKTAPPPRTKALPVATATRESRPSGRPTVPEVLPTDRRDVLIPEKVPVISRVVPRPRPVGPRSPFTVVGPGETLADVARRVYGSPDAREAVWKANRDQLARVDSPLARGTLLRTP